MSFVHPLALVAAGAAVLGAVAAARSAPPPPCLGRYLVHGGGGLVTGTGAVTDAIRVDGVPRNFVAALEPACSAIRARVKPTARGTKVTSSWRKHACGVPTRVRLRGRTSADCRTLAGTVKAGGVVVPFMATQCGDGLVDVANGEACDGAAGCSDGLACVDCRCGTATTTTTLTGGPTTTTRRVGFARDVYPILAASCLGTGCHAGPTPAQNLDFTTAAAAYAGLTTMRSSENPCAGMPLVAGGEPEASVLIKKLTGTSCGFSQMPLGKPMLPASDLATIRAWIAQGAASE